MPLEAFSPGVEKRSCKSFELKDFGVCNMFFCIQSDRPTQNLAFEERFFWPGAECLDSHGFFFCRDLIQSAGSVKSGKSSQVRRLLEEI